MNIYRKLFLAGSILLYGCGAVAQDVPYMWVSETESGGREDRFRVGAYGKAGDPGKRAILSNIIGSLHPTSYSYPLSSFSALIDTVNANNSGNVTGVRVYFVAYDKNVLAPKVTMGRVKDKQVVLLFVASKGCKDKDLGNYYIIDPVDHMVKSVPLTVMQDWQNYYIKWDDNPGGLVSTLQSGQAENQMPTTLEYSDTRNIFYCLPDFVDYFVKEPQYQASKGLNIDHIQAEFGAYTDAGDPANNSKFKDRLMVLYEFVSDGEVVYIEDTPGYSARKHKTSPACSCLGTKGGDNGQLCPPNCPCLICIANK